jgi:hypothetical protein
MSLKDILEKMKEIERTKEQIHKSTGQIMIE